MSKSFDIIMAGFISGLVALTTNYLGVAGTVIGAVLGAILYQIFSIFIKEPLENTTIRRVENEIVYIIPLVLIATFLGIFIIALLHSYNLYIPDFLIFFQQLEDITKDSLVRFMGIGLIAMGIYPLIQPKNIKREYGAVIFVLGIILLIRGLIDINLDFFYFYSSSFKTFDLVLILGVFLVLLFMIIIIFLESINLYLGRNKDNVQSIEENNNDGNYDDNTNNKSKEKLNAELNKSENVDMFDGSENSENSELKEEIADNLDNKDDLKEKQYLNYNNAFKKPKKIVKKATKSIKTSKTTTMSKNTSFFKKNKK